jgi:tetratricopeptide (TPR) repeat protein
MLAQLSAMLTGMWFTRGHLQEADRWITLALGHRRELSAPVAAQLLSAARSLARQTGDYARAGALSKEALALWRDLGGVDAIAREMINVGTSAHLIGDLVAARAALTHAIEFARNDDLTEPLAVALNNLADLAIGEGEFDEARSLEEETLALAPDGSVSADIPRVNLAHVMMLKGYPGDALVSSRDALESAARKGNLVLVAAAAIEMAWALAAQDQFVRATRLRGSAVQFHENAGVTNDVMGLTAVAAVHEILGNKLGPAGAQTMLHEAASVGLEEAVKAELDRSVERA